VALAPEILAPLIIEPGLGATEVLPEEVAANRRRVVTLCLYAAVVPALVVGLVIAVALGPIFGAVALVVVGVLVAYSLWRTAPTAALRRIGAVPLGERDNPRLLNVTEGLCATFGLRMPELFVVFDAVPNACALGRDSGSAELVVTSGLLETMGPIELEGIIAHELAHVKRGDNGVSSIALSLGRFGGEGMLKRCVGESREYRADVVGASAVRFPRGLLDGLRLMMLAPDPSGNSVFGASRFGASRWIWTDPSVGHRDDPVEPGDLNATAVRAAALSEW
jgi:Zn-dependent protease with chaperone function